MINYIIAAGAGWVIGAFTPNPLRVVKSWFVKESTTAVAAAPASVQTAVSAAETAAKKL